MPSARSTSGPSTSCGSSRPTSSGAATNWAATSGPGPGRSSCCGIRSTRSTGWPSPAPTRTRPCPTRRTCWPEPSPTRPRPRPPWCALDDDGGGRARLAEAVAELAGRAPFAAAHDRLLGVGAEIDDLVAAVREIAERIEPDPERLDAIRQRPPRPRRSPAEVRRDSGRRAGLPNPGGRATGGARAARRAGRCRRPGAGAGGGGPGAGRGRPSGPPGGGRPRSWRRRSAITWRTWPWPGPGSRSSSVTTPATTSSSAWPRTPGRRRCRCARWRRGASWPGPCWPCAWC